ncbi:uncharacterized protein DKFZp434B061-like [Sus scrofa]|uniref:uncharacterized protein DKFZp434B061-like n=1 Tax=Sus scrofa TaxID=9823 RepID=UPI000A2B4FBE|nr:uncharacterized protein DKFZp434B061-like [Sus scrofa]
MSRGSATLITSKGFPSCHLSCPGSSARPPDLPIALLARCSCAWVGREVAQPQDLGLWEIHLRFLPHPSPPPFSLRFPACLWELGSGSWRRSRGGGRGRGGVGAGWVGREPGGCGLAATLQLVAGDPGPPARWSDGGEEIRLDTHTRTQLGTSPGGSRRGPGGGRDSTSRRDSGAHTAWPLRLQRPGRQDPSLTDSCSFGQIRRKQAAQGAVTEDPGGSPFGAQSPGPRRCPPDSGSGGRPYLARAAGARSAVPGSSLLGKCRKRALNSTTSRRPPPPRGSPPWTSPPPPPPAPKARPPLTLTRARTAPLARSHPRRLALRRAQARASETTGPTANGTAGDAPGPGATCRGPPRPGLPPAPLSPPGTLGRKLPASSGCFYLSLPGAQRANLLHNPGSTSSCWTPLSGFPPGGLEGAHPREPLFTSWLPQYSPGWRTLPQRDLGCQSSIYGDVADLGIGERRQCGRQDSHKATLCN